jgi:hypothetical protein
MTFVMSRWSNWPLGTVDAFACWGAARDASVKSTSPTGSLMMTVLSALASCAPANGTGSTNATKARSRANERLPFKARKDFARPY